MVKFKVPLKDILQNAYYQYELYSSDYNPSVDSTITITCTCKNVLGNPVSNKTLELFRDNESMGTQTTNANGIATWTNISTDGLLHNFRVGTTNITVKPKQFVFEEIPNGSNLNNYYDVGFYHNGANAETTNITNLPNNNHTAFCLSVEDMGGNARKQTLTFQDSNPTVFVRERLWDNIWTSWVQISTNSASNWTSQTVANSYGTLYVNTAMRLCEFKYGRSGYNFSKTSQVTLHTGAIPSAYRPKNVVYLAVWTFEPSVAIESNGNIIAKASTSGTKNINGSAFWHF